MPIKPSGILNAEISPSIAHDVNINGTINFLELALKQSRSQNKNIKFFFPSSIAVYGVREKNNHAYKEYESLNPITIYGANKLYAEKLGIDKFDLASSEFHQKVRQGYLSIAMQDPNQWLVLDATKSQQTLSEEIWAKIRPLL